MDAYTLLEADVRVRPVDAALSSPRCASRYSLCVLISSPFRESDGMLHIGIHRTENIRVALTMHCLPQIGRDR